MKNLYFLGLLLFPISSFGAEQTNLSIEEYVTEYRNQIIKMTESLNGDKVPTYVDGIKIKMSIAVKKSASGSIEFWVVQAGANIENLSIQEHELNLTFGKDGRQRVAELNRENNNGSEVSTVAFVKDLEIDVLLPVGMKTVKDVRLIAVPASVDAIYASSSSNSEKLEVLETISNTSYPVSWSLSPSDNSKFENESKWINIEGNEVFKLQIDGVRID